MNNNISGLYINSNDINIYKEVSDEMIIHYGDRMAWRMLFIYGISKRDFSMLALEDEVNSSQYGKSVQISDLINYANYFIDIYDMVIIGNADKNKKIRSNEEIEKIIQSCDIVIERFDSTSWRIFSHLQQFIINLKIRFKDREIHIINSSW